MADGQITYTCPHTKKTVIFDPGPHTYTVDGAVWPSVSSAISAFETGVTGKVPFAGVDRFYAERGIACHSANALWIQGKLDESTLDPQIAGFFNAFKAAARKLRIKQGEPYRIEELLVGEGYCGTADLITDIALIDWKTGKHRWSHWMQMAAYRKTKACAGLKKAGFVYLAEDGSFDIRWMPKDEYARGWRWFWAGMDILEARKLHTRNG